MIEQENGRGRGRLVVIVVGVLALLVVAVAGGVMMLGRGPAPGGKAEEPSSSSTPVASASPTPSESAGALVPSADFAHCAGAAFGQPWDCEHSQAGAIEAATVTVFAAATGAGLTAEDRAAMYARYFGPGAMDPSFEDFVIKAQASSGLGYNGQLQTGEAGDRWVNEILPEYGAYRVVEAAPDRVTVLLLVARVGGVGTTPDPALSSGYAMSARTMTWVDGAWRADSWVLDDPSLLPSIGQIGEWPLPWKTIHEAAPGWDRFAGATERWPVNLLGPKP